MNKEKLKMTFCKKKVEEFGEKGKIFDRSEI